MTHGLTQLFLAALLTLALALPALAGDSDSGTVKVINDTEFTLDIKMDGTKKFTLKPDGKQSVKGISPGLHTFTATTPSGEVKFSKEMRLKAGQNLSWYLKWTQVEEGSLLIH